ncbi:MAG: response regulator [Myxococcaceae bacterium]|nr:response regulator [Myxococcaceae bacterium]
MPPTLLIVDDNKELLALLTGLFEEAGYTVAAASKGKPALDLAKDSKAKLAIVDLLLPDMMGYQLADALRTALGDIPFVFITGVFKGTKHSTEALQRHKAAGFFEKPFDAKKLLESVKKLVPPDAPSPLTSAMQSAANDFEVELDIDVEEDAPQEEMELTGKIRVTGGGNISAELRGEALHASGGSTGPVSGGRPHPPAAVAKPKGTRSQRTGQLGDNLPGLITAFYLAKETGELGVQRGKVKKVIYFEGGNPVFALSNLAADRFGQFLVRVGKIKPEQLQDAAVVASASKRRTGDVLVERGQLKDTERLYYVGQQVKAIIYSAFGWEDGSFVVSFREKARSEVIKLDVFPGNLILRGVKKLYKPERLARLIQPEDRLIPSPQPAYALNELELEKWEAQLLLKIDGVRTNAEVIALAGKPEHQVRAFLVAMLGLNVIEKRA